MDQKKGFSITESLKFGFFTLFEHFAFFLGLIFVQYGIAFIVGLVVLLLAYVLFFNNVVPTISMLDVASSSSAMEMVKVQLKSVIHHLNWYAMFGIIALLILGFYPMIRFFALGNIRIAFDFYDRGESYIKRLFSCGHLVLRDLVASLLYWLMCGLGFACFIVPGIYLSIRYAFVHHGIVYENLGVFEAFHHSAEVTYGSKWKLLALNILFVLMNSIATVFFGITLFIIWPASILVYAHVYRTLLEERTNAFNSNTMR